MKRYISFNIFIEDIYTLALTYSRNQQHEHDSEPGFRCMVVLPETERRGTSCTVQSYKIHTRDTVLPAQ